MIERFTQYDVESMCIMQCQQIHVFFLLLGLECSDSMDAVLDSTLSDTHRIISTNLHIFQLFWAPFFFQEEAYTLFFANTSWYLFLRLHAILCERLRNMYERAQILAAEEQSYRSNRRESTAIALRLKPMSEIQVEDYYPTFLDMLKNILDGNMDSTHYEDSLREMFGIHAYTAFTLDRVSFGHHHQVKSGCD